MNHDAYLAWKSSVEPAGAEWRAPARPRRARGVRGAVAAMMARLRPAG